MHEAIAGHLRKCAGLEVRTATLDEKEHGLTEDIVTNTDVFVWWGHMHHDDVADAAVQRRWTMAAFLHCALVNSFIFRPCHTTAGSLATNLTSRSTSSEPITMPNRRGNGRPRR